MSDIHCLDSMNHVALLGTPVFIGEVDAIYSSYAEAPEEDNEAKSI